MGPGALKYFTDLAREDYYTHGGEPPGLWLGEGAKALGLSGKVDKDELRNLFRGFSPDGLDILVQGAGKTGKDGRPRHHPGWDATFSAPKSLSVLWSQADPELRAKIQKAHLAAVKDAVAYLEHAVAYTRRGKGGEVIERAPGLVVAAFEHGTSRAQDPEVHTHALILNVVPRHDGTTGTLYGIASSDPRRRSHHKFPLYEEKLTTGAVYRASLAAYVERDLGFKTEPREDFGFEVIGVPDSLNLHFSKRRADIKDELRAMGRTDAKSAQRATLATREKKAHIPRQELFARWAEEGRGHDFSLEQAPKRREQTVDEKTARKIQGEAAQSLQDRRVFTESEFVRATAERATAHAVDGRTAWRLSQDELKTYPFLGQSGHRRYFATPELSTLAQKVQSELHKLDSRLALFPWSQGPRRVSDTQLQRALDGMGRDGRLSPEQDSVLRGLVQERGAVRTVEGLGGLDRLRVLQAARRAWEAKGHTVYAVTPSYLSSREFQSWTLIKTASAKYMAERTRPKSHGEAFGAAVAAGTDRGIQFRSLNAFLKYAEKAKHPSMKFDRKTVLIVDDPARIDSKELTPIVERVRKAGGTVVLATHEAEVQQRQTQQQQDQPQHAQATQQAQKPPEHGQRTMERGQGGTT